MMFLMTQKKKHKIQFKFFNSKTFVERVVTVLERIHAGIIRSALPKGSVQA